MSFLSRCRYILPSTVCAILAKFVPLLNSVKSGSAPGDRLDVVGGGEDGREALNVRDNEAEEEEADRKLAGSFPPSLSRRRSIRTPLLALCEMRGVSLAPNRGVSEAIPGKVTNETFLSPCLARSSDAAPLGSESRGTTGLLRRTQSSRS